MNSEDGEKKKDPYDIYKHTKLASAIFAYELADRLKGSNISVLMTDPGRTRTKFDKAREERNFISRSILKLVGFLMGERRVQKAVRPIMYAVADPEMKGKTKIFIE